MSTQIFPAPAAEFRTPTFLRPKPLVSWLSIELGILYLLLCWAVVFFIIRHDSPGFGKFFIEADSSTYYQIAGVADPNAPVDKEAQQADLVTFNGNLLGPVYVARFLRTPMNVALFNTLLLIFMVELAGGIPGVRRRVFLPLFIMNAQTLVAIATLNKEIFAAVGVVAFMRYYFSPRRPWLLLAVAILFSLMARWEQVGMIFIFMLLKSRFSPFRHNNRAGLIFVILGITLAYPVGLRTRGGQLAAFLVTAKTAGVVARLDAIQAHFGFFLIFPVKIMMNLFDRWMTPWYFLTGAFWGQNFHFMQTELVIPLQALATLIVVAALVLKRRFQLDRAIPYLIALYLTATAVNPFIQPRYEFPVYALMCLELARRANSPEPPEMPDRWKFRLLSADIRPAGLWRRLHEPSGYGA